MRRNLWPASPPILFDTRYSPYLLASWCDTGEYPSINGNLLVINARFGKRTEEQLYVVSDSRSAHELPNADAVGVFAFFSRIIADLPFRPTPLKMFEQASTDYASLVMSCLSRELNRSVFVYGTDISFVQVPTDIAVKAFQDKAMFPPDVMASFLKRLIPLHERRFQNLYTKKKPSVMTFTLEGVPTLHGKRKKPGSLRRHSPLPADGTLAYSFDHAEIRG